jgi:phosphatidylinositol alpha-1,6-mannosyltransferase
MRVLFLTDSLSDLDGVGRYGLRLIRAMEQLEPGLQVRVLLSRKHRPTSREVPPHWRVRVGLPPDYFFHMSRPRFWLSALPAVWNVWGEARGCDLVHAIKDYPHNWVGLWGARLAGLPCVATAHGTYTVQPLLVPRHAARAHATYARFARMISVSRYTARRVEQVLREQGRSEVRLEVIPNAVSADHYRNPRALGPKPWHGKSYTLSIGELKERKGHHLALAGWCAVAARHPQLEHFVVGKHSDPAYRARLDELLAERGLSSRVHFLGNVDEEEKVDLLQRARVFLHTPVTSSDGGFEGFGIVYLEAAACGVPSIGTTQCGAEDAIRHGETGFLVPQDPAAVAEALERLLGDPRLAGAMAQAARELARRSSWRDNARRVLALYREVLA